MKSEKKAKSLNPYLILLSVVVVCAIFSYFVTPGAFDRAVMGGKTIVVPGSYHSVVRTPVSFFDIFRSIPNGLVGSASIMFLVMLVGGFVKVYNDTGALDKAIAKILSFSDKVGSQFILIIIMIVFSCIGGFLGWSEQIIPFVPLVVSICLALGYDVVVGMACSAFVDMIAFSVSPTNVYTVGISHQIAELPMFSGMGYRLIILLILQTTVMIYILRYAAKVKKDPAKSLVYDIDVQELRKDYTNEINSPMSNKQALALLTFVITFIVAIYGVLNLSWSMNDLSAVFVLGGIVGGIICSMGAVNIVNAFIDGAKGSLGGAMVIGIARSIQVVLEQGGLIDPAINMLSQALNGLSPWTTAIGVFIVVTLINAIIPSGSGKAIALMPILIPLADMIGITRQTATLAYQFGDGLSNTFWFTNGTLLIFLSMSKIPLQKWYKFALPLHLILVILTVIFLGIATKIGYGPF